MLERNEKALIRSALRAHEVERPDAAFDAINYALAQHDKRRRRLMSSVGAVAGMTVVGITAVIIYGANQSPSSTDRRAVAQVPPPSTSSTSVVAPLTTRRGGLGPVGAHWAPSCGPLVRLELVPSVDANSAAPVVGVPDVAVVLKSDMTPAPRIVQVSMAAYPVNGGTPGSTKEIPTWVKDFGALSLDSPPLSVHPDLPSGRYALFGIVSFQMPENCGGLQTRTYHQLLEIDAS